MRTTRLKKVVADAVADAKGVNVVWLDVRKQTDITDYMVVVSGTSSRHVKSVAERVIEFCQKAGQKPVGVEGIEDGEWVLIDLADIVVHAMLPRARDFYDLERLWGLGTRSDGSSREDGSLPA
jgi:ribosome-associated protein